MTSILAILAAAWLTQQAPRAPTIVAVLGGAAPGVNPRVEYITDYPILSHYFVTAPDGPVLDSRQVSAFSGGQYLVWTVFGHVRIEAALDAGPNALVSGVFLGPHVAGTRSAAFVRSDIATQGSWKGIYGVGGFNIASDAITLPADTTLTVGGSVYVWNASTLEARALQKSAATDRVMAAWYGSTITLDFNVTGSPREIAVYFADYDASGRAQTFTVHGEAPPPILDSWVLAGWEIASFAGATLVKSQASETFPNPNEGQAWFTALPEMFPTIDVEYTLSVRYVQWTTTDANRPHVVTYSPWIPAPQKVIRRADGTIELR